MNSSILNHKPNTLTHDINKLCASVFLQLLPLKTAAVCVCVSARMLQMDIIIVFLLILLRCLFLTCIVLLSGVDEDTIINILVKRTNEQRQQIKAAYQKATGKVISKIVKRY